MSADPIEISHGEPHLARTRPSDLETVDTAERRRRNHDARGHFTTENDAARENGARRELTRTIKAVRDAAQAAPGGPIAPEESREVARVALALYGATKRTLGRDEIPVLARAKRASVNDALADFYTAKAAALGFESKEGLALLDAAHRCEGRAERSMTAALAFARVIASKPPKGATYAPGFDLDAEGEESP